MVYLSALMARERGLEPQPATWGSVQALVRHRPVVSARAYLIGSGDDSWVPRTSSIVPLCPSVWLRFGYSACRLFCGPRQERVELGRRLAPHPPAERL